MNKAAWRGVAEPLYLAVKRFEERSPLDLTSVGTGWTWTVQHLDALLLSGCECAHACAVLLEQRDGSRIPPAPVGALVRATLICAARAMWIVQPVELSVVLARGLTMQRHYLDDEIAHAHPDESWLQSRRTALAKEEGNLDVEAEAYPSEGALLADLSQEHGDVDKSYGYLSAYAHGSSAMLQGQLQIEPEGVFGTSLDVRAMRPHAVRTGALLVSAIEVADERLSSLAQSSS